MGQRVSVAILTSFSLLVVMMGGTFGCDRAPDASDSAAGNGGATTRQTTPTTTVEPNRTTVASLVPAATDLLVGIGATRQLVAVSNWDPDRPETRDLPRVGDYRTIDWEKLGTIRPGVLIVQFADSKTPPGLVERASAQGMRIVNVRINRLDDVFATLAQLGEVVGRTDAAKRADRSLRDQLDSVRRTVEHTPRVRTLMTRAEPGSPLASVGGGNFLDELLSIAGGENVLAGPGSAENAYPVIDVEKLLQLNPSAVLALWPGAGEPQVADGRAFWRAHSPVAAVRDDRVYFMTESDVLLPGMSIGRIAERFAQQLHPHLFTRVPTSGPASRSASTALPGRPLRGFPITMRFHRTACGTSVSRYYGEGR